jgi:hypothetical protein
MAAEEHERYDLKCKCGQTGRADWYENDGYRAMRRGLETTVIAHLIFQAPAAEMLQITTLNRWHLTLDIGGKHHNRSMT